MAELHYTASEEAARKQRVQEQFESDKQEALRLITVLTDAISGVSRFSMRYGVDDVDDFIGEAKTVRASLYQCVESIEMDQAMSQSLYARMEAIANSED